MSEEAGLFDRGPLRFLPVAVREPRRAWLAIMVGAALTLSGSLILSWIATLVTPDLARPDFAMRGAVAFAKLVLLAPIVETLIMAAVLIVLSRFMSPTGAVLASAVLWAIAHSVHAAAWGLVIWWPFLIFSTLFMVWRERGTAIALAVAASTHALQNLPPGLVIALG